MGKPKYDVPTTTFPYKIPKRLNILSEPRKYILATDEGMPVWSQFGIRKSALRGQATDRVHDAAWPYLRRFLHTKKSFKSRFSVERLQNIDRMVEAANATCYSKLANCCIDLKKDSKEVKKKRGWSESEWKKHMDYIGQIAGPKPISDPTPIERRFLHTKKSFKSRFSVERLQNIDRMVEAANATIYSKLANCCIDLKKDSKEVKKKRGWSESDWKKHMDYIGQIAGPKPISEPTPIERGPRKNIAQLLPKMTQLAILPDSKIYRRVSQEVWYKDPMKVSPAAMKYVISDRIKRLSEHKVYPPPD